ncbi:MAG: four helix bundle protein [Chloroflexi bacterium]|nr:four helix bundle protein [Chloroflexota bacterium]
MKYQEWLAEVPVEIADDPIWKTEVYRLGLFLGDLAWHDAVKLTMKPPTRSLSDQLYRAAGSVSANTCEGYSRASGKDQARFYEYALGSARETRDWYFKARHVLGPEITSHRLKLSAQIIRQLLRMIPKYRGQSIGEEAAEYLTTPLEELLENVPIPPYQFTHHAPRTTNEEEPNE